MYDVVVIGAGQAGLATAHALEKAGLDYLVVEAGQRAAGSWPSYYNSLKLFSPAAYSSLPGMPFPGDPQRYPSRDEVVSYLEAYARHFGFPICFDTRVDSIARSGRDFVLHVANGKPLEARAVVVASGPFNQPNIPDFPGLADYQGKLLHSSAYRSPTDIAGKRVAVIGAGNSALQIAHELSAHRKVTLISRECPRFLAQRPLGIDVHAWLTYSGMDRLPVGHWFNWQPATPVLDHGEYSAALASGRLPQRRLFDAVTPEGLRWGNDITPFDTLLLATGFHAAPDFLDGLDGLDKASAAAQRGGISSQVTGLYFVGQSWQRSHASATLRGVGLDARFVIKRLQSNLGRVAHRVNGCGVCCS